MTVPSKRILAGLALLMLGSTSALAADAQAFANRLKVLSTAQGLPMSFAGAEESGDNVVLKGVTIGEGANASAPTDVTFEGVTGSDAEGWTVARIPVADIVKKDGAKTVTVSGAEVTGFKVAGTAGASTLPGQSDFYFDSAKLAGVTVEEGGAKMVEIADASLVNTAADGGGLTTEAEVGSIKADFTKGEQNETTKAIVDFGYPQLSGTGSVSAAWNPTSGELSLDPLNISFENVGALDVSYQVNGYTPAFIASMREVQKQMAANPDGNGGMAVFGLLSQLSLASTVVSYSDDSFANKMLDYQAKQAGTTREALIAGIVGQVGGMLASLQNPEFQTEVSTAVETFLKDPQSLTVAIEPDAPIPATQIMGAAMGAPQTLPSVLHLSVTANDVEDGDEGETAQ
ncbi:MULTISPECIES: hypothetical protein [unclassified Aureimonas]|uniref:hypothetical protein n=1 Tax=unclassified Aureimonas TaxID=2615206 RepID=UPI0006FC5B45|nr:MULTISPECIES: hypothetical protein [unclassified Aureimonas]KQT52957.1 hypothetical protein ASG62_13695 [Aureimonas sp. Leaf427]KQT80416.1 hypothetical protein ASG54_07545 [Aureimonas sp. Leaf460]